MAAGVAQDGLGNLNTAAAQRVVRVINEGAVRKRTTRIINNFIADHANQITSDEPDFTKRLRNGSQDSGGSPISFAGEGDFSNHRMAFATSLRRILNSGRQAKTAKQAH